MIAILVLIFYSQENYSNNMKKTFYLMNLKIAVTGTGSLIGQAIIKSIKLSSWKQTILLISPQI